MKPATKRDEVTDEDVVAYFDIVSDDDALFRKRVVRCEHSSADLIDAMLDSGAPGWAELELVAAQSPNTDTRLVRDWVLGSGGGAAAAAAARNPTLGAAAETLWIELDEDGPNPTARALASESFLGNHAIPEAFLVAHWIRSTVDAVTNPVLPTELLREILAASDGEPLHVAAMENPALPQDLIEAGIAHRSVTVAVAALAHPALDADTLARVAREDTSGRNLHNAARAMVVKRRWAADPLGSPASLVSSYDPTVAAALRTLDGTGRDAARTLVRNGFDGTVTELVDVAATFQ